jgi:phosphoglycerate dehydrogenase-like enzyme
MARRSDVRMLQSLAAHLLIGPVADAPASNGAPRAESTAAHEPEVVLALVPLGHASLPLLEAAVAEASVPSTLVHIQTAADIPTACNARGMVVVHNQGGTLAGKLDTDAELRLALKPGVLPQLQWVHTMSAGVDHLPHEILAQHDPSITLTHNQGVSDPSLAEFAMLGILYFSKRVSTLARQYEDALWAGFHTRELRGTTVGVVGLGSIGCQVAKTAVHGFGMTVLGYRRSSAEPPEGMADVVTMVAPNAAGLRALLQQSDYVVLALPQTAGTVHLIGAEEIALMKSDAVVVNIGRGSCLDSLAVAGALVDGTLGGAALDVVETEPLEDDHPLWSVGADKLLLSPHTMDL